MKVADHMSSAGLLDACPLPDVVLLEKHRRCIAAQAASRGELYWPSLRQQLLALVAQVDVVDTAALALMHGIDACLSVIDISPYRTSIQTLDKPQRSDEENLAFLHFQEQIIGQLSEGTALSKAYLNALDASLLSLETSFIDDVREPISELQARLETPSGADAQRIRDCLDEFRGVLEVEKSRASYLHEMRKLLFAVNYFFDNVLEGSPDVIQRAEDFQRHSDELIDYLRELRRLWKS